MNFLAHFYLDRDCTDSYYAVGAATPDLLSIFNAGLRIKAGQVDHLSPERQAMVHPGFLAGLARHFHADRVFHSSELFSQETHYLSAMLAQRFAEQDVPRKYFVAHILLELLLDKVLIERDPELLPAYYKHFEGAMPFSIVRHGTEVVSGHDLPNYEAFLMKFSENRYLYHYVEYDHLIYILRRLLRRVGIEQTAFLEDQRFTVLMHDFEQRIATYYETFFTEIRAKQ
jgi:hypothetical protein